MRTYEALADLPLAVESCTLEPLELAVSPAFKRLTTVVRLRGGGHEGVGEDVAYGNEDQLAFQRRFPRSGFEGRRDLRSFSRLLEERELWPEPPSLEMYRPYRRWAFESAALDLALRQAGLSLAAALGREARPVRFAVSLGLGSPPSTAPLRTRLAAHADMRFKLDATSDWGDELVAEVASLAPVDVIDLKGAYRGTPVDQAPDPALYRRIAEGFPEAWIEDPCLVPETEAALAGHEERITWDAPIHSLADVEALARAPRCLNVKPSRFGSLERLLDAYDHCAARGIAVYGGGQFELGPGRGQIQALAALFHPDAPNDVAPTAYHGFAPGRDVPASPLEPRLAPVGFWY